MTITETVCPAESVTAITLDAAEEHDCCNDADKAAETGKPCKAEQDCQPVSQGIINQTPGLLPPVLDSEKMPAPNTLALTFEPSPTWRPPTQA